MLEYEEFLLVYKVLSPSLLHQAADQLKCFVEHGWMKVQNYSFNFFLKKNNFTHFDNEFQLLEKQ